MKTRTLKINTLRTILRDPVLVISVMKFTRFDISYRHGWTFSDLSNKEVRTIGKKNVEYNSYDAIK